MLNKSRRSTSHVFKTALQVAFGDRWTYFELLVSYGSQLDGVSLRFGVESG